MSESSGRSRSCADSHPERDCERFGCPPYGIYQARPACVAPDCTLPDADDSAYCTLHSVKWGRWQPSADARETR